MGSLLYPSLSLSLAAILTGTSFPRGLQKPNNYKTSNAYQSSAFWIGSITKGSKLPKNATKASDIAFATSTT
jgi:hypothetical protein